MTTRMVSQAREDAGELEASLVEYCFSEEAVLDRHLKALYSSWISGVRVDYGLHNDDDRRHFAISLDALTHYHLVMTCGLDQSDELACPLLTEQPH